MKVDAGRLRQAMASPSPAIRLYLLHGSDEGAAQAAARQLASSLGADVERIDLDGAALRKEPGRLACEAASPSLFGTPRYVRVTGVGDESLEALELLLAADSGDVPVIALAPTVRASARIVKLANEAPAAMACAFYPPMAAEAERMVVGIARDAGLQVEPSLARQLVEATGADQAILHQEIAKFALYLDAAPDRPQPLDEAAVAALRADHGELTMPDLAAALVDGEPAALGAMLDQAHADGVSTVTWLRAMTRRLLTMLEMRTAIDGGEPPAAVMKKHRVFFRDEAATLATLRRWSPAMLAKGLHQIRAAERAAMGGSAAGPVIAKVTTLAMARGIAARR